MKISVKNYKALLVVPVLLMTISVGILVLHYMQTGEWFDRSFELTGGTLITVEPQEVPDLDKIEGMLSAYKASVRGLRGFTGYKLLIQTKGDADIEGILGALKTAGVDTAKFSVQTIGPALGESFWRQTQIAMALAFVFMGIVIFMLFRQPLPSVYVIVCAFFDMVITLAFMQVFGIELSLAGLGALLMMVGYSVDTDILMTTHFLKEAEKFEQRLWSAVKTGLTMTGTTLGALTTLYLSALSPVITQIAAVLIIGLCADIIMTWLQNSVLLRMYMERKGLI